MEYRLATHLGSGVVRNVVDADGLVVVHEKSGRREEVPFDDVREVNLRQELQGVYTMRIVRRSGRTIIVPARHFEGVGRFEDRAADYAAFVRRFHELAVAHGADIRFVSGSSVLYWLGWFFLVFGALFAAFLIYALGWSDKPIPRPMFGITPVTLLVGAGFVKQGGTRVYDPRAIPAKLLPAHGVVVPATRSEG